MWDALRLRLGLLPCQRCKETEYEARLRNIRMAVDLIEDIQTRLLAKLTERQAESEGGES